ncbi:cytoplasmic dynein 1 light intermediate chain 1 [Galendromus occidentalis]|uniref:Dynein light intermediate chain n=1 Tax=Galendromus occidentalis TaxID=34638 RepID=A0AAJ6VW57_9ACAR|nr:cytoplasmic dynein 1 light intermediate chain 1 [Galendromus occidentalis]
MASSLVSTHSSRDTTMDDKTHESEESQNICSTTEWSSILKQVQSSQPNKLPSQKVLLVLGDNEVGKTTLMGKLAGVEDPKRGSGLEYHHLLIKDDYTEDTTRLGVWVLDGDPWHRNLLRFALNEVNPLMEDSMVVLTASMATPWSIASSLESWANILEEHISRLKLSPEYVGKCKKRILRRFQEYTDPGDDVAGDSSPMRRSSTAQTLLSESLHEKDDKEFLPLGEETLSHNLGLDMVVVITKTDTMPSLEKEHEYRDEHFDFIQQWVRRFCLRYGAALVYTSAKEANNCDLLFKYISHRVYGVPHKFVTPGLVVEKESVFIPSGWDSENKIAILYENIKSANPDDSFSEVIMKPLIRKPISREPEVQAEDDQRFLDKLNVALQQISSNNTGTKTTPLKTERRSSTGPGIATSGKKDDLPLSLKNLPQIEPGKGISGMSGNEGVLHNFFNSLLTKKSGPATSPSVLRTSQGVNGSLSEASSSDPSSTNPAPPES